MSYIFKAFWILICPSPKLVAPKRLKNPIFFLLFTNFEHRVTPAEVHASKEASEWKHSQSGTKQTDGNSKGEWRGRYWQNKNIKRSILDKKREKIYLEWEYKEGNIDRIRIYREKYW